MRQLMAERQINAKKGNSITEKYPTTKMTEGNESADHGHGKKDERTSRDEDAAQEKEDKTPVKVANAKAKRGKGGSKSDSSEPADDESEKNNFDDDVPLSFPQRMMEMLSDESNVGIVCWLPHGKGFVILDKKRFSNEVMPKYFSRKAKFTSFTRKLNRWSFTRVTRGPENGAYYHPLFQKDNLRLCMQMSCINSKAPQAIQPMNPVALGLAASPFAQMGMMMADPNNPAQMALLHDRQKQLYQQQLNHHGIMAMAAMHNQAGGQQQVGTSQQGGTSQLGGTSEKPSGSSSGPSGTSTDVSSSTEANGNPTAMSVFQMQQRQYYGMLMAQQQQMAAMAAGNPAMMAQHQHQMAQFQQPAQPQAITVAGATEEQEVKKSSQEEENAKV